MDELKIRSMLFDIVGGGGFPGPEIVEIRHIEKIEAINEVSETRYQFWVERHPHLFGKPTLGGPSSAMALKHYLYELDTETKTVKLMDKVVGESVIDIPMLAMETVDNCFLEGSCGYEKDFDRINTEEEANEFAIKKYNEALDSWLNEDADIKADALPGVPDFKEKYIEEVKKQYIVAMVMEWDHYGSL